MKRKMAALVLALMLISCARAQSAYVIDVANMTALVDAKGNILIGGDGMDAVIELERDALYAAGTPGDYGLYDATSGSITGARYEMLEVLNDIVLFRQDGRYGAMDAHGQTLIAPEWAQLTCAGEGAFLALEGDLYDDQPDEMLSLSVDGEPLNTGSYTADRLRAFHDGRMAFMQSDGQYGYVDALGRQVIPPQWQYAGDFSDGVAMISDGFGMGLIDTEGQIKLAPRYRWMWRGEDIIAALGEDGVLDVYAADGTEMLFSLDDAIDEAEVCGMYVVVRQGDAARLYDETGTCIFGAPRSTLFYPGLAGQFIAVDGAWGEASQRLYNADGSAASGAYQRLLPLCGGRYAILTFSAEDYDGVRYGLLGADGRELLPAVYRDIRPSGEDRLILVAKDAVIFADLDGNALREWPVTETSASSSEADA